jgi:hypothetical protein
MQVHLFYNYIAMVLHIIKWPYKVVHMGAIGDIICLSDMGDII